jgi:hypothetical protein
MLGPVVTVAKAADNAILRQFLPGNALLTTPGSDQ